MKKVKRKTVPEEIKLARRVSTPLMAVVTPDQPGMTRAIIESFNGTAPPIVVWDCARGLSAGNKKSAEWMIENQIDGEMLSHPVAAITQAMKMPRRTMCIMHNAQDHLIEPRVRQAVSNCRDVMKGEQMTLVLMAPSLSLPESLSHDVMVINDPLPDEEHIESIVKETVKAAQASTAIKAPKKKDISESVASMRGLSSFEVEQATALTLDQLSRLDAKSMFERRNSFIENVKGLSVDRFNLTYGDIRGVERAKWFCERLFNGPEAPHVILRIDELDKKLGGVQEHMERQGATQGDELSVLLETMEDEGWSGQIDYGQPGGGKTLLTRTTGPTFGVQTLTLDLGGTRSKYVGESEANVREAMRTVKAIGGNRVYVMATCNELDSLKPELKRRFTDGVFFFDLPEQNERQLLWALYMKQYDIKPTEDEGGKWAFEKGFGVPFNDEGWTGAEIRNACWLSYRLNIPLTEAAQEIIPVAKADPQAVERRRMNAHKRFKSAHKKGMYQHENRKTPGIIPRPNGVIPRAFEGGSA